MVGFDKAGCKQQYIYFFLEKLYPTEECANGMAEFLYIIKELQTAYTEDMRSSAHVQADYTLNSHMEDTSLLGCHE
jgi:chloramphenicol O-acetyltransferase